MEPERTSGTGTAASLPEWGEPQQSRSGETETDGRESWDSGSVSSGSDGNVQRLYIEMKYDTGRLEDSQKKMLKALAAAGHYCTVCYGAEEAIRVLREYINLKKIDAGKREDTMSEQNLMIRKNGKVKCIIFKE